VPLVLLPRKIGGGCCPDSGENTHTIAAKADRIWLREEAFMSMSFFSRQSYATSDDRGVTAGATLIPTVMNAHMMAAKTDAIWLREERVMFNSFSKLPDHSGYEKGIAYGVPISISYYITVT
jgi:hypothetical protein